MIKRVLILSLIVMMQSLYAEKPTGFLWYNVPKAEYQQKHPGVAFHQLSYTDKDAVLRFYTMEALHKVRFTHSLEDERVFLALQDYWLREATIHGRINQQALLQYPEYDFSVTHPTSNLGTKLQDSIEYAAQRKTLRTLARNTGLLFFYRAKNPIDQQQIPILRDFCETHHFSLIPISVDGTTSPDLSNSRRDFGQADSLHVRYFPAVLLVNPKTHQTLPVAYGLTTQDVFTANLMLIARQFQGDAV